MLERLVIAGLIIGLGLSAWILYNRWTLRRVAAQSPRDPLLADLRAGVPVIVFFTTPFCVPCRTQQKPALVALQSEMGADLEVILVDATKQPDIADRWGVFSAPTTFVLDEQHIPRHVNRGVASAETLKKQLSGLS